MKSIEHIALEVAKNFQYEEMDDEFVTLIKVIHEKWLAQQDPSSYQELADAFVLLWSSDDRAAWDKKAVDHFDAMLAKVESGGYLTPPTAIPEGWQSIETAPTDGTYVLLFEKYEEHPFVGCYAKGLWKADHSHVDACGGWDGASVVDNICQELVSYWQPLPPPPGEKKCITE